MSRRNTRQHLGIAFAFASLLAAPGAFAGIPECGDIRLEDVGDCELRANVECRASCSDLGIYKKACATKLQKVCRSQCTLSAEPTCTDSCTTSCTKECDAGVSITCIHNCFKECTEPCQLRCVGSEDPERCVASCEATCDADCDMKCRPVVNANCYTHCIECCGGSCSAQANMDCQTTCQDEEFETCEHELRVDCDGSCSATGALFCDGEFVLAADDIAPCVSALAARGIAEVEVKGSVKTSLSTSKAGCSMGFATTNGSAGLLSLFIAAWTLARRRRTS